MAAGRGSSFAIALAVALGAAAAARAASPDAHVVRIDRMGDGRLDGLASAVRAELLAAGFKIASHGARAKSGEEGAESAVITLTVDGPRARVTATADGAASSFSAEVVLADAGAARRDMNQVALQVAEWLAAIWLPPPASTGASAVAARAVLPAAGSSSLSAASPSPAVAPSPAAAAVEPVVPAPFVAAPVAPVATATAAATVHASSGAPPAASRMLLFDFGVGVLRAPDLGAQFGFELGAALHGTSRIVLGAIPFARLALGVYWVGSGIGSWASSHFDVNFASLTAAAGLGFPLGEKISVEAGVGTGLTAVWLAVGNPPSTGVTDRTWVATPGGALALVYRFSPSWALAGEVRASWMVPGLVFVARYSLMGDSYGPLIASTLALRITR